MSLAHTMILFLRPITYMFLSTFISLTKAKNPKINNLEVIKYCQKIKFLTIKMPSNKTCHIPDLNLFTTLKDKTLIYTKINDYLYHKINQRLSVFTKKYLKCNHLSSPLKLYSFSFFIVVSDILTKFNIQLSSFYNKYVEKSGNIHSFLQRLMCIALNETEKCANFSKLILTISKEYFYEDILEDVLPDVQNLTIKDKHKQIFNLLQLKCLKTSDRFIVHKNYKYFRTYIGRYNTFFYKNMLGLYYHSFLLFFCKNVFESKEFKIFTPFLKDYFSCFDELVKLCSNSVMNLVCLHDLSTSLLIKARFVSFLLFGKYKGAFISKHLPKYKIMILLNLKLSLLSMLLSFIDNFKTISAYKKGNLLRDSMCTIIRHLLRLKEKNLAIKND